MLNYNIRQHLIRRHIVSSRCHRCWISQENPQLLSEHHTKGNCKEVGLPTTERFMDQNLEDKVRKSVGSSNEQKSQEVWWSLFQLLIPEVHGIPLPQLKQQYNPCKYASITTHHSITHISRLSPSQYPSPYVSSHARINIQQRILSFGSLPIVGSTCYAESTISCFIRPK